MYLWELIKPNSESKFVVIKARAMVGKNLAAEAELKAAIVDRTET